jgi:hypothetical protein
MPVASLKSFDEPASGRRLPAADSGLLFEYDLDFET